ncbi:PAS domain S-box protein, partial [Rhodococcus sp. NPDC058514]|uniref:PAS domain S-box protein n=1 Tax=Rhodococcus sp. NPDC058514 TaxID=3346532 RepID=UPI00365C537B
VPHYGSHTHTENMRLIVKKSDDHVVDVNRAFADLLGYSLPEARGLGPRQFVHPSLIEEPDRGHTQLINGEQLGLSADVDLVRKDGCVIRVKVNKSVARHNAETVVMTVIEGVAQSG